MKNKPIFKNETRNRIQIIRQGIPVWLDPGEQVVGEPFRVFTKLGLTEVKPKPAPKPEPKPEKPPVTIRKDIEKKFIEIMTDDSLGEPEEVVEVAAKPEVVTMPSPASLDGLVEEPKEELAIEIVDGEELEDISHLVGESLVDSIVEQIGEGIEALPPDGNDELIVVDDTPIVEDNYPHKCDICGQGFASKRGMKTHKRRHK